MIPKQANDWHREATSHELQHALDQMYHVSWQCASVIWFLNGPVTSSTHGPDRGFSLSNHLACARVLICLFERAPGNARKQIQSSCYRRVTGRVSLGGCDGQSSYLWFKDWRGSEPRRFSSEGNIKAAVRFVLPACFALSFLVIFFFCMGICLCHESSTKDITYHAETKRVHHKLIIAAPCGVAPPLMTWPSFIRTDKQKKSSCF